MRKSLIRVYNEFADTYDESRGVFDMTAVFDSFYRNLGINQGKVLDLGCGAGEPIAAAFVKRGWSVTGVDFSEKMLELASRYVPKMRTLLADMREVDFGPGEFDAVTIIYALFHVPRVDQAALLERMFRWLRPGGKALFTYATREYTGQDEFDGYKEFMGQQLYYSHKTPDDLYEDLLTIGFEIQAKDYRDIGGEVFLWVTVCKPQVGRE